MSDPYLIAPAQPRDLPAIAALARLIWDAHYPGIISRAQIDYMLSRAYGPEKLACELAASGHWFDLLRRAGGEEPIVGYANYWLVEGAPEMKLDKFYLLEQCRGQGLGSRLLRHVEARSRALGCLALALNVNKRNTRSIAIYRSRGFRVREECVIDIGGGFVADDYVMEKRLD